MGGTKCGHECRVCACMEVCVCVGVERDICAGVRLRTVVCISRSVCLVSVYAACQSLSAPASRVRARGETLTTSVILLTKWWQKISHGALMTAGVCQQALSPRR